MQNMAAKFKSATERKDLANALKKRRKELGLTLRVIQDAENIDVGQLSRFERGGFITFSTNLQKYCNYLQIKKLPSLQDLGLRLEKFATQSPQHRAAAEEILNALERLS